MKITSVTGLTLKRFNKVQSSKILIRGEKKGKDIRDGKVKEDEGEGKGKGRVRKRRENTENGKRRKRKEDHYCYV